jgi:DnaK suppressor protein
MQRMKSENSGRFNAFQKRLVSELKNYQSRVQRARQEVPVDSDPDDAMGLATRSASREMTMANLERHLQTIIDIEKALERIEAGQYATCVRCQTRIPDARLQAIPWTRICVHCAGGGTPLMARAVGPSPSDAPQAG